MRSLFFAALTFIVSILFTQPAFAQSSFDWEIEHFHSEITVNADSTIHVIEVIDVEFFTEKRGIFREIPIRYYDEYRQGSSLEIDVLSVKDKSGAEWEYQVTESGGYITIRIGNPSIYLDGKQSYAIEYTVDKALGYFGDHDELYWDVTGNDWFVPILSSSAIVHLPDGVTEQPALKCFTGAYGSTEEDCDTFYEGGIANFDASDFLTIVVGWQKGLVAEPTALEKTADFAKDNWAYSWPLITFILMYMAWLRWGKDPQDPPGLLTQYEPPLDLTPAEVAYVKRQWFSRADLPAELIHLASQGFIHIKEKMSKKAKKADDYILIKKKDFDDPSLKSHQKEILKGIFLSKDERKVSDIPSSFYNKAGLIKKEIVKQLQKQDIFKKDPATVRSKWMALGVALLFLAPFTFAAQTMQYFVGVVFSGLIVIAFAFIMPKRTQKGMMALEHVLGFEQYISIAEDRRVKWEEEQNLFFQFLPYAMVFGLAKKWANAFDSIFAEGPEWYEGDLSNFDARTFQRSMNVFNVTTRNNITPPASSGGYRSGSSSFSSSSSGFSGGGFSGGGGGGGGGGSW